MNLTLQEILIVGNCNDQVKFSELTMDMFRMLQTLEREPQEDFNHIYDASPAPGRMPLEKGYSLAGGKSSYPLVSACQENGDRPLKRENPHKYLLYKPTFSQVMVFLASGFKELPANGALLLYISADGCFSSMKHPEDMGYDLGGVLTSSKKELDHTNKKGIQLKEMHCLYPGDLYPFTRKPFFVIVDSDNSFVFQHIPRYFGQPLVVLMSPQDVPPAFQDSAYLQFFGDDFLRLLLLRYVFCDVVLHLHRSFKGRQFRPRCQPPLPDGDLLEHPALQHLVLDLASHLEVRGHFMETNEMD
ncbi:Uncharacterized protein GBIM_05412 [Gryllus bimaculatus]|nr:Uncharacterized protein GBIM_05412 [Gryllus bimaculatus]